MAKNKRKKKLKEQDFQKVKLKVGKKLHPAQNATDTSFKSRAIFIPTQLNNDSEPTNQRNQTLKDLLKQVGHYSVTTRQEALVGLKDLFQCHESLLQENLGIVIKRVAEKMTDSEPSVRQSLLLLLCFIFPMVPQEIMAPFASLIIAHLSCAMTHIYDDIQHDSLGFLELCLRHFPALMVTSSSQLIHNFIGMISHQSTSQTKKTTGLQLKPGKGLSVNPKGRLSSLRSRLKVLQQLLAFLKALETSPELCTEECGFPSVSNVVESITKPVYQFSKLSPTQVLVLQNSVDEPRLPSFMFDHRSFSNTDTDSNILTVEKKMKDFMEVIVPLLIECWIECNPVQMTTGLPDSIFSSSATDVMLCIAKILKVIFKAAQRNQKNCNFSEQSSKVNWLQGMYLNDLNQHLMSYFPFIASHVPSLKKGKRKLGRLPQQSEEEKNCTSVLVLNLTICEIMFQFVSNGVTLQNNFLPLFDKLEEFIFESLELKARGGTVKAKLLQTEHMESLVTFAYKLIVHHCSCGQRDPERIKKLLQVAFSLYQSSHIMSGTKKILMLFFANIAFLDDPSISQHAEVHGVVERWLQGLPGLLVQLKDNSAGVTELVLGILKKAVMQGAVKPDDNFVTHLAMFFSKSNGPFCTLSESIQRSAVELLFHLPTLNDKLLRVLVCCCQDGNTNVSVFQYMLQILHYRSPCYQGFLCHPAAFSLPLYLSTLFSVVIGFSRHILTEYQDAVKQKKTLKLTEFKGCSFIVLEESTQVDQSAVELSTRQTFWDDHQKKLQAVLQCFKQCKQSKLLLQYMASALGTFLEDFKVLPLIAAHSFLSVVKCLVELATESESPTSSPHSFPAQALSNLVHLSLVCLKHSATLESYTEDLTSGVVDVKRCLFDAVVGLFLALPPVMTNVLSLLLKILSDDPQESLRQDCAAILTKVLCSEVKKLLLQSPDAVPLVVSSILCSEDPFSCQKQCFADLKYQFSLFKVEAGLS